MIRRFATICVLALASCAPSVPHTLGSLRIDEAVAKPEHDAWYAGADEWNDAVGETVINDQTDDGEYVIHAEDGSGLIGTTHGGMSQVSRSHKSVMVMLKPGMSADNARLASLHELGHALGLPHSHDPLSVMYWKYVSGEVTEDNPEGNSLQHITSDDVYDAREVTGIDEPNVVATVQAPLLRRDAADEACAW